MALKSREELEGEFLREAAVLVAVFYPLEAIITGELDRWVRVGLFAGGFILSIIAFWLGVKIEENRND
ncbi:MAG: hypothetical protein HYZ28_12335 [Myxococcales bacterium]|nr:hypothetical protein [Myxococcales bacterium]